MDIIKGTFNSQSSKRYILRKIHQAKVKAKPEEPLRLLSNSNAETPVNGDGIVSGPYYSNPSPAPTAMECNKDRGKTHLNNSITIAHWNLWGLSNQKSKINIINSIDCDIIALQEIGHPHPETINLLHKTIINQTEREV